MEPFSITDQLDEMDFDRIYEFISQSYWAKGIPPQTLKKALRHSLCFAVISSSGHQVGFARMITDRATFAYLADVFILPDHQGKGLSKLLMNHIIKHPDLQGLRRIMLATADAHGLYQQFGFEAIESPEMLMQIWQPNIYQNHSPD